MKQFLAFVKKEVFHILRDFRTLIVMFGLPVIQILVFGFAVRTEVNEADIGILDKSKDHVTTEITNKLLSSGYFNLKAYLSDDSQIEKVFKSGEVNEVVVFSPNFGYKLHKNGEAGVQIICDASNPNLASLLSSYTYSIVKDYQNDRANEGGVPIKLIPEVKMLYNPQLKSVFMFVPGLMAFILLLMSALMTSIAIAREKEFGTMEVLLVTPLKPAVIILGKVLPYILLALLNAASVLVISLTVFEIPFEGSFALFTLETLLFLVTSLSLGILISTLANTQQVAMMVSLAGLMMPTMLLSGFIFPVENMPVVLQYISHIIPAKWFLVIIKGILLKGVGFDAIWKETVILLGMTVVFIVLSIRNFKIRLE